MEVSERRDWNEAEDWREVRSLPRESREVTSVLEQWDKDEAVETQRESSGQAPMAKVGETSGEGEGARLSMVAMIVRGDCGSTTLGLC